MILLPHLVLASKLGLPLSCSTKIAHGYARRETWIDFSLAETQHWTLLVVDICVEKQKLNTRVVTPLAQHFCGDKSQQMLTKSKLIFLRVVSNVSIVTDRSIVFVCQPLQCLRFDEHYQAFGVPTTTLKTFAILPTQLIDFYSYARHTPAFVRPEDITDEFYVMCKRNFRNLVMKPEYEE